MSIDPFNLLVILGPTASGKTRLAVQLAHLVTGEILSADSRQVFRGMDIGTGKDLAEYGEIPHHLIDIVSPGDAFSLFAFQKLFYSLFTDLSHRKKITLLAGGTGLYIESILRAYPLVAVPENPSLRQEAERMSDSELVTWLRRIKPNVHNTSDQRDRSHLIRAIEIAAATTEQPCGAQPHPVPEIRPLVFGLRWERAELRRRIAQRLVDRLENGLIAEVQRLHDGGVPWTTLDNYGLEYRFVSRHLLGEITREELQRDLTIAIGQFAKRQESWFRRMERNGIPIHWLDGAKDPLAEATALLATLTSFPI